MAPPEHHSRRSRAVPLTDRTAARRVTDRVVPFGGAERLLRPPSLVVGVGAARGAAADEIVGLVVAALATAGLSPLSIAALATVEAKADEPGIVAAARRLAAPLVVHPAGRLAAVPVPHPSAHALRHTGTPSVAEAAALAGGGELLVPKRRSSPARGPARATCAVARRPGYGPGRLPAPVPDRDPGAPDRWVWTALCDAFPPWEMLSERLGALPPEESTVTLINPGDLRGSRRLSSALALFRRQWPARTPVEIMGSGSRTDESSHVTTLAGVDPALVDMMSVVTVGNSATRATAYRAATPPGLRWQA
ncbi:cobalamin biosynthesis protein [Streptomyces sp. NPDC000594]|uniref:cobalamin biosynthesis protein n=1 Tax=Streptomyces sp. NPDC000594 TaxID=3154261 RepID=UPI00332B0FC9